ncbi:hypothetical protein GO003_019740 [Methylicorpusculum oleiharenae]|uniref:hypothetical protein n=1 Tax=Methylicorpusculum oleiharenae TaxID=1338687 RepID=UPI00135A3180|nr:hypothetical protein [Methylicorpusculum oleiharenae]MCD2452619.1 hypothetical protein [Methylicorpusculum oleiharenae]
METSAINTYHSAPPLTASKENFQTTQTAIEQADRPIRTESENKVKLSDDAVKLSRQFQKNETEQTKTQISDNQEAQATINDIKIAMQNDPGRSFSAQSNFTSNMIRSLTG